MQYANLHLHSFYSDGVFTPRQLCELAKEKGYGAVAVSDHETARGVPSMRKAAAALGLETIAAMETYAFDFGNEFHILAYDFDPEEPGLRAYTDRMERAASALTRARFESCLKSGAIRGIAWRDVTDRFPDVGWLCNEQVFDTLKALAGYTERDYWTFFDAFQHALAERPRFEPIDSRTMISIIREAGGVAVLAHPHRQTQYLPELLRRGLGGVEACHPDIDADDEAAARAFAREHRLYTTGGTDHTGRLGTRPERGDGPSASGADGSLTGYTADVSHGSTRAEFDALRQRVYG